jgi:hypothetical protein
MHMHKTHTRKRTRTLHTRNAVGFAAGRLVALRRLGRNYGIGEFF